MESSNKIPSNKAQTDKDKNDREAKIDEQLDQTFPASDPPSYSKPGNDFERTKQP